MRDGDAGLGRWVQVLPLRHRRTPNRRALTSDQGHDPVAADADGAEPFRAGEPSLDLDRRELTLYGCGVRERVKRYRPLMVAEGPDEVLGELVETLEAGVEREEVHGCQGHASLCVGRHP